MKYKLCRRCVMDTSDPDITFDEKGCCNHCSRYLKIREKYESNKAPSFEVLLEKIKKRGKKYPYDCLLGISGGTDSSYLLHLLKNSGLRILAFHYDSGWNTPEAIHNVKVLTEKIGVELLIYSVDWPIFKEVQIAYFKSGVVDLEIPTDHALMASLFKVARNKRIPYVLTGTNLQTESIMPSAWVGDKIDSLQILDIYKKYGNGNKLRSFPLLTPLIKFYSYNIRKIERIFILNYLSYNKEEASEILKREYNWEAVRVKHGESIWTRFYQCHILPELYGVDKRRAHFSNLIMSGVMQRDDALQQLNTSIYKDDIKSDLAIILNRFQVDEENFYKYFSEKKRSFSEFRSEKDLKKTYHFLRSAWKLNRLFRISTRH